MSKIAILLLSLCFALTMAIPATVLVRDYALETTPPVVEEPGGEEPGGDEPTPTPEPEPEPEPEPTVSVWDGTSTEQPTLQDPAQPNSEENPYLIASADNLAWISENYEEALNGYFLQTVDIDLNNEPWTPINHEGMVEGAYYYNGGNHTISNLYINSSGGEFFNVGLFGGLTYNTSTTETAYIKNLGIVGGSVFSEFGYAGAFIGRADMGKIDLINCYNDGVSVTGNIEGNVGGLAGMISGTISYCYNTGDVTTNSNMGSAAGIAGDCSGNIIGCFNTGNITGSERTAGIVGHSTGTIINCYNTGDIIGTYDVGGVVGYNHAQSITNCYNTGDVTGGFNVGGVVGNSYGSTISSAWSSGCIAYIEIANEDSGDNIGGVLGYDSNAFSATSMSYCYYNTDTAGDYVTAVTGSGTAGYQCYGLTTAQMQGDKNQNYMYLSDTVWNFASGQYPTLKNVATATTTNEEVI